MITPKKKVLGFIHTYSPNGKLDPFIGALVESFAQVGFDFHLIVANDLLPWGRLNARCLHPSIDESAFSRWIKDLAPDFIFSTNHAGLTPTLIRNAPCPVVTWMVDRIPFMHHPGSHEEAFQENEIVITSSRNNVPQLQKIYPKLKGRVHFLPFATEKPIFANDDSPYEHNISFVGTYFYRTEEVHKLLTRTLSNPTDYERIIHLISSIEDNYNLDLDTIITELNAGPLLKSMGYDKFQAKLIIGNLISMNSRIKFLDAIADQGLSLFGTKNWVEVGTYSTAVLRAYRPFQEVLTRRALLDVYKKSRISLNIHHHQAVSGLPYRVFDIMASRSLLVTPKQNDSDLYFNFGNDLPVPTFSTPEELRKICAHFLADENDRRDAVKACNDLIMSKQFTFEDRVKQIAQLASVDLPDRPDGRLIPCVLDSIRTNRTPLMFQLRGYASQNYHIRQAYLFLKHVLSFKRM